MPFQISALPLSRFAHLLNLSDAELVSHRAVRVIATHKPGFPCRVSLEDANVGEEVLLVHYQHHTTASPFQASHAVYIRPTSTEAILEEDQVPDQLRTRTLSLRAFDETGMMIEADLSEGVDLKTALHRLFQNSAVSYIHIHFAKPGCYAAIAERKITA